MSTSAWDEACMEPGCGGSATMAIMVDAVELGEFITTGTCQQHELEYVRGLARDEHEGLVRPVMMTLAPERADQPAWSHELLPGAVTAALGLVAFGPGDRPVRDYVRAVAEIQLPEREVA